MVFRALLVKRSDADPLRETLGFTAQRLINLGAERLTGTRSASGQQRKFLTVTDEFTKEALAITVGARLRSTRVIEVLSRLVSERGAPRF